jgi:hypothetical protein
MATEDPALLEAGMPVLIVSNGHRDQVREPATVVKVGRSLYHVLPDKYGSVAVVQDSQVEKFAIATRRSASAGGNIGYGVWLRTPAEMAAKDRHDAARQTLRDCGLEFRFGYGSDWSTEALEELAAAVTRLAPAGGA